MKKLLLAFITLMLCLLPQSVGAIDNSKTQDALDQIDQATPNNSADAGPQRRAAINDWIGLTLFFAPALITGGAIAISGSVLGTFVMLRRESLLALALPQVVTVGAAIALRFDYPTLPCALAAVGLALTVLRRDRSNATADQSDATIPVIYVSAICLSFLIVAHSGQHVQELQNLFTGIDVAVTPATAWLTAPLTLAAGAIAALLWRRWLVIAQIPSAAELMGLKTMRWNGLFLVLLTLVILLGTNAQGVVMTLTMLFLPAGIVRPWCARIPMTLIGAAVVAIALLIGGFVISNVYALPLSSSVGATGFGLFVLSRTIRAGRSTVWAKSGGISVLLFAMVGCAATRPALHQTRVKHFGPRAHVYSIKRSATQPQSVAQPSE